MDHIWIIGAGCLAVVAGVLLWLERFDGAFVAGALGILAWFLDVRSRLSKKKSLIENVNGSEGDTLGEQDED